MPVRWRLLTPTTVAVDGEPVELTARPRSVLLLLLTSAGTRVSIETLADALWGTDLPDNYRNSVARFVADLRRTLGPYGERILTKDGGYVIEVAEGELDRTEIIGLVDMARSTADTDLDAALRAASAAKDKVGLVANPWVVEHLDDQVLARRNQALRGEVIDTYAQLMMRGGRHREVIADLEHALENAPHDEGLWRHLIVAFQRSGRTAEALRAGQRLRAALADIGLEPSDDTLALEASLVARSSAVGPGPSATSGTGDAPIGRVEDLRALRTAVEEHRLVSLVGPAGVGKSHLAGALIADLTLEGATVYRIDVRPLSDASQLIPAIASAVGVPPGVAIDDARALAQRLAPVSCLIVLDGCDHLRAGCGALADALRSTPGVDVLATARIPCRGNGEYVLRLGPISTSPTGSGPSDAAALFAAEAGRALDDPELPIGDIEAICTTLLGHPGAIRLAADQAAIATVAELRGRLEGTGSGRPADPTSRVLDLAWDGLPLAEQGTLARLSVVRGGCTLGAASAVSGTDSSSLTDHLDLLIDRGLLQRVDDRFFLDEPIRAYASDRLDDRREREVASARLITWLRELTSAWGLAELAMDAEVGRLLVPELANITEALRILHARDQREDLAWLAIRSAGMWINHGHVGEIGRWLGPLQHDETLSAMTRSAIAVLLLEADMTVGRYETIPELGARAMELAGGEPLDWIPGLAGFFAMVTLLVPMPLTTDEYLDLAQATAEHSDSRRINQATVLLRRAQVAHHLRRHDEAVDHFRAGLELVPEEGRLRLALEMGETISLYNGGRRDEALASVGRWRSKVDTDEWHYQVDIIAAIVVGGNGDPEQATRDLAAALRRHEPISVWARAGEFQIAFGLLADMRGEPDLAAELLATPVSGSPFLSSMVAEHMAASRNLGPDGYQIVAEELRTRTALGARAGGDAADRHQLEAWWKTGRVDAPEPTDA